MGELDQAAARSFVYSGAIALAISGLNVSVGLLNGVVNALASVIECAVRPIFDEVMGLFGGIPESAIYRLARFVVVVGLQIAVTTVMLPGVKVQVLATLVAMLVLNVFVIPGIADRQLSNVYTILYL